MNKDTKVAHRLTVERNQSFLKALPFENMEDFNDAARGFIATIPGAKIENGKGGFAWSMTPYEFQNTETAPDTVNPSLWRQARLNNHHGLFEVVPGVYQIRGFDLANMTIVEGRTGIIIVDTTTTVEAARAGLALYREHHGDRAVMAVVYTHTHADHWGGIHGLISVEEMEKRQIPIIAPEHFNALSISEYVIAGSAMERRAHYQFGTLLPVGERQQVDTGLGKGRSAGGTTSFLAANDFITHTGECRELDGIKFAFQMAPNTEAPAEFHIYLPEYKVLNLAENATHVFHNLLPFRGTQARNSFDWSRYINEAIELWGHEVEVLINQHHWPIWGNEKVITYLGQQRDLYKYVHDQTLRLANHGYKPSEISEMLRLPSSLDRLWHTRGYYGHLRHNVKAIYQYYFGWYDANPANLDSLPPVELGKKMIEYMGGIDAVIAKSRRDFENGEFRFVAQIMSHAVFADPMHIEARELLADTFEQIGYSAECGTWRNAYLFGAYELRHERQQPPARTPVNPVVLSSLGTSQLFDFMAVRLNGEKADKIHFKIDWIFTDNEEIFAMNIENSALTYVKGRRSKSPDLTLSLARSVMNRIILGQDNYADALQSGSIKGEGDTQTLFRFLSMLDEFPRMFEVVEPKQK